MKAKSFREIPSRKYVQYHLTDHARDSITERFPAMAHDRYLAKTISIMIFNGKFVKDLENGRKVYSYKGLWVIVAPKDRVIVTLFDRYKEN